MQEPAIRAVGLGKRYRIGASHAETLRSAVAERLRGRRSDTSQRFVDALDDVTFDVDAGSAFGIIGRNGAGKSTLLKILSRVTKPTSGFAEVRGSIGSLLEIGTGFQPDLTGRENVFLSGAILGMSRKEISTKFDDIVAFAEVERFIDTAVKRYSSGMLVRLGFAVAAFLDAEILLIDEVLAVGDAAFQRRCLGKTREVARQGRTVCVVSHQLGLISSTCDEAILLDHGRIIARGPAAATVDTYVRSIAAGETSSATASYDDDPAKRAQIVGGRVLRADGDVSPRFDVFEPAALEVTYDIREPVEGVAIQATVRRNDEVLFQSFDSDADPSRLDGRSPGRYRAVVALPSPLKEGRYDVELAVWELRAAGTGDIDVRADALTFTVESLSFEQSLRSYCADRPGLMAAHLEWRTTHVEDLRGR